MDIFAISTERGQTRKNSREHNWSASVLGADVTPYIVARRFRATSAHSPRWQRLQRCSAQGHN